MSICYIECPECDMEIEVGVTMWTETLGSYAGPYAGGTETFAEIDSFDKACDCDLSDSEVGKIEDKAIELASEDDYY